MKAIVKEYRRFFVIELVNFRALGEFYSVEDAIQKAGEYKEFADSVVFAPSYEILIIDRLTKAVVHRYNRFEYHTEDKKHVGHLLKLFLQDIIDDIVDDEYAYKVPYDVILKFLADQCVPDSVVKRYSV